MAKLTKNQKKSLGNMTLDQAVFIADAAQIVKEITLQSLMLLLILMFVWS